MTPINIEKRCKENTDSIRNRVAKSKTMTPGEKNAILNRLADLDSWSRKVAKQQLTPHYRHAAYDARTNDEWLRPTDGARPYKQYWLVQKEGADA